MNKRFELTINSNGQCDIVDWEESKEKNAICIYNDLGNYHFSSAKALCELLNKLHEKNKELKEFKQQVITLIDNNIEKLNNTDTVSLIPRESIMVLERLKKVIDDDKG